MTLQDGLNQVMEIKGAIGACLVDTETGMTLGSEGSGQLDLEVAAASNTEVVRAKREAIKALGLNEKIEDILMTLSSQYHLLRTLGKEESLVMYVVLDREKANLAMARHKLAAIEKDLQVT